MKITINLSNCKNYDSFFGKCYGYVTEKDNFDDLGEDYCYCKDIKDCDYKKKAIQQHLSTYH